MEGSAGVFFELKAQRRHHVEGGVKLGKILEDLHHAPVVLQGVQAGPRKHVATRFRVAVLRLVHVPEQDQMDLVHRGAGSRRAASGVLHSPIAPCAFLTATSSARYSVMPSSD